MFTSCFRCLLVLFFVHFSSDFMIVFICSICSSKIGGNAYIGDACRAHAIDTCLFRTRAIGKGLFSCCVEYWKQVYSSSYFCLYDYFCDYLYTMLARTNTISSSKPFVFIMVFFFRYAGVLNGMTITFSSLASLVSPLLTTAIVKNVSFIRRITDLWLSKWNFL